MADEQREIIDLKNRLARLEGLLGESKADLRPARPDQWDVIKNGESASRDNVMILEGPAESLQAVRELLSSKEHWRNEMRGVAMVKW